MPSEHLHHRPTQTSCPPGERPAGDGPLPPLRLWAGTLGQRLRRLAVGLARTPGRQVLGGCLLIELVVAGILLIVLAPGARADSGPVVFSACVNNSSGTIHMISATDTCNGNEQAIKWNQTGPQGPAGPAGPQGPAGPASPLGTDFSGQNLAGKIPPGANLPFANLSRASGTGLDLHFINLYGATLEGATLLGANLSGANLSGANLFAARLANANLVWANLTDANLTGVNLGGADLTEASLNNANLTNVVLINTNLTGANLTGANLTNVATMTGVTWSNTICPDGTNSNNDGGTCVGHGV